MSLRRPLPTRPLFIVEKSTWLLLSVASCFLLRIARVGRSVLLAVVVRAAVMVLAAVVVLSAVGLLVVGVVREVMYLDML